MSEPGENNKIAPGFSPFAEATEDLVVLDSWGWFGSPFQGLDDYPGRCPGLVYAAPLGLWSP